MILISITLNIKSNNMINIKNSYRIVITFFLFAVIYFFPQSMLANSSLNKKFISYTDIGNGDPLILIHPFPTDQRLWEPQREGLKRKFRVITLDLWGFGKSSPIDKEAITMAEYADEIKQLLDQLHIQKAIIAGESMGGYIALAFLEKFPDNVNGLVLSDTQSIADSEQAKAKRESTAQDVLAHGTEQLVSGFIPKALTSQASDQMQRFLRNILEAQAPSSVASALRGMALRNDTSNLLSTTQLPILIITGQQDALISPLQSQTMHQLAKNSTLIVIENAAHLSSLEQSEQWNQTVINTFYKSK